MTDVGRVALAARVFTIAALTSLAARGRLASTSTGPCSWSLTAVVAIALSLTHRLSESTVAVVEGGVVAVLAVLTYPDQATVTPYLVIPALIGAARPRARPGVVRVIVVEFGVLLAALGPGRAAAWTGSSPPAGSPGWPPPSGIGVMGAALRRAVSNTDADASYRSAVGLIRRLEALSGKLSGGLDAVGIAEQIMDEADSVRAHSQRRRVRADRHRRHGSAPLLRRDRARRDGLGRGALGEVLGVRGDDAARAARRHPPDRQRRDDRGPGPRHAAGRSSPAPPSS